MSTAQIVMITHQSQACSERRAVAFEHHQAQIVELDKDLHLQANTLCLYGSAAQHVKNIHISMRERAERCLVCSEHLDHMSRASDFKPVRFHQRTQVQVA